MIFVPAFPLNGPPFHAPGFGRGRPPAPGSQQYL